MKGDVGAWVHVTIEDDDRRENSEKIQKKNERNKVVLLSSLCHLLIA